MSETKYTPEKPLCKAEWKLLEAISAERDRLKEINEKLLATCKAARESFREVEALTWAIGLVTQLDTAIAEAEPKEVQAVIRESKDEGITVHVSPEVLKSLNEWRDG